MKKVYYQFFRYAGLNILGMLFLSGYILADTFFISKAFGAEGLAALNFSIPVYSVIHATGLMISIGGATKFSFLKARGEDKKADQIFTLTISLGALISLFFMALGIFSFESIAGLLGADSNVIGPASVYLKTILIFAPVFIMNNILLAFIRNDHAPKLAMLGMALGSMLNIVLDYIFIFLLDMGMFGAAFATCIAPAVSILILLFHFILKNNSFGLRRYSFFPSSLKEMLSLGSSSFVTELSSTVVLIVFNLVIFNISGNIGVAAYGIIANVSLIVIAIFTGIAQGIQPLVSKSSGRGDYRTARNIGRLAIISSLFISSVIYIISIRFRGEIVGIFNSQNNTELALVAKEGIIIYFFGFFFAGVNIVSAAFLSSVNRPKPALIISIARACLAVISLAVTLSLLNKMQGVWLSFVSAEFLTLIIILLYTRRNISGRNC